MFSQDVRSPVPRESSRKGELLKVVRCSLNHLEERTVANVTVSSASYKYVNTWVNLARYKYVGIATVLDLKDIKQY